MPGFAVDPFEERVCRTCGCTDMQACINSATGETCAWVEEDLCSACAPADPVPLLYGANGDPVAFVEPAQDRYAHQLDQAPFQSLQEDEDES